MNVFFGKMNDPELCNQYKCWGGSNKPDAYGYFGGMEVGDLAFVRLEQDKGVVKRLWKLEGFYSDKGGSYARFSNVFSDRDFFDELKIDKFSRLNFFKIGIVLGNRIWKQVKGKGFFKLDLTDSNAFNAAIANCQTFNQYIDEPDHYRKIVFVKDKTTAQSDIDIQICKNGSSYDIYNSQKGFLSELKGRFNSQCDRYNDYIDFLGKNPDKKPERGFGKVKKWLESEGAEETISILHLWDFFCSQQPFAGNANKNGQSQQGGTDNEPIIDTGVSALDYKNLIIYGIPGCGKSYLLKNVYLTSFDKELIIRTTFHPEYSNTDFIGQVRPLKKNQSISYEVIPGPFTEALKLAVEKPAKKAALVIEEINRGNAAAIFGDLFQLLDRTQSGESEYEIKNQVISEYLGKGYEKIKIPSNLYLFATMNTSDQNVFKLDTAFKRRWEFERLTNKDTLANVTDFVVFSIGGNDVTWKDFIQKINDVICKNDDISGDRQIGNFFYIGADHDLKRFANKVLEYLYNDVFKYGGREDVFNIAKYKSFDEIYDAFIAGNNVFADGLFTFEPASTPTAEATPTEQSKE